jgi:hypothetical protein
MDALAVLPDVRVVPVSPKVKFAREAFPARVN